MTQSLVTEQAVIGMLLQGSRNITAASALTPDDFVLDSHRRLLTRIRAMDAEGLSVDLVSLLSELTRKGELEATGGAAYLAEIYDQASLALSLPQHIAILQKYSARRRIVAMGALLQARAEQGDDPADILAEHSQAVQEARAGSVSIRPAPVSELVLPVLEELEQQRNATGATLGIPTGIPELDEATTGWRNGELSYLGGLPGRGKTSLMLQCCYAAAKSGVAVGFISLEMKASQLMRRLAIIHSGLRPSLLRDPRMMTTAEHQQVKRAMLQLGDLGIYIVDKPGLNASQVETQAHLLYEGGARFILCDFVQAVRETGGRDPRERINLVSAKLRDTCKALDVPFLVGSQLSRGDKDQNRRPTMQDLRESGNLEQDCHNALLIYRPKDEHGEWTGQDEILIEKSREGETGRIDVTYNSSSLTFVPRNASSSDPVPISTARSSRR